MPDSSSDTPPPPRRAKGGGGRRGDPLGPDSEIGSRLRELYAAVEQEPIPADLIDLLEKLDEAERRGRE